MSSPRHATPRHPPPPHAHAIPYFTSIFHTVTSPATSTGLYSGPSMQSSSARYEGKERFDSVKGVAETYCRRPALLWRTCSSSLTCMCYIVHKSLIRRTAYRRTECCTFRDRSCLSPFFYDMEDTSQCMRMYIPPSDQPNYICPSSYFLTTCSRLFSDLRRHSRCFLPRLMYSMSRTLVQARPVSI